jgi:putative FmdB family regulatory protein
MPLYEYYCNDCNGVFELLRTVRLAGDDQPCPECDADAKRIISREFAAFIFRDGMPRRLPDRGTFWHLGQEVERPITGPTSGINHPDLVNKRPADAPSLEELEFFEYRQEVKRDWSREQGSIVDDVKIEEDDRAFKKRMRRHRNTGNRRRDETQEKMAGQIVREEGKLKREIKSEQRARKRKSD